ncbi:AMP-binding protein [Fluviispira sanaruensis]|uniref:O-succinylbenzoate-CoA ligase menE n=1 Tax=Fluviispira sanaruensis TaxID=2493639 RepID=A0A4V0P2V0_FLUSA|nr:AMP-binding protein [Fluviispira sanaruensis]BBH54497.1 o-succinylbenzoate-CoA ligase menE [Fluviispira sanaruensis]
MNIDWHSKEYHFFMNPRIPLQERESIEKIAREFCLESHIFLATSGSTALSSKELKWVALKKEAILNSSLSVNRHLECTQKDILINTLPYFHIGGLSLYSRAFLSQAKLINLYSENYKWSAFCFIQEIIKSGATLSSLVPTQIFDIVQLSLKCPSSMRAIVVGGGALAKSLYEKAVELGWNLLPSYGMTECCSQVATALPLFNKDLGFAQLKIMDHLQVWCDEVGRICIAGNSLLSGYILLNGKNIVFHDPRKVLKLNDGKEIKYISTSDIGKVDGNYLSVIGRSDDVIKISGENVNLVYLESIILDLKSKYSIQNDLALIAQEDLRLGKSIVLVIESNEPLINKDIDRMLNEFNNKVFPFERIRNFYILDKIPRTDLGKLKRTLLNSILHKIVSKQLKD